MNLKAQNRTNQNYPTTEELKTKYSGKIIKGLGELWSGNYTCI